VFRESFRSRRCLVPTSAFFDRHRETKKRYRFAHDDGRPLMYAGIWDHWTGDEQAVWSFCIITCPANELVVPYNDRMPVIVPEVGYDAWLSADTPFEKLKQQLMPYPSSRLTANQIDPPQRTRPAACERPGLFDGYDA
jgi:putative SOS response-associated peptidase YedK